MMSRGKIKGFCTEFAAIKPIEIIIIIKFQIIYPSLIVFAEILVKVWYEKYIPF